MPDQGQRKDLRLSEVLFFVTLLLFSALLPALLILPAFWDWGMRSFDQQRWLQLGAFSLVLAMAGFHRGYWRYWFFSSRILNGLWLGVLVSGGVSVALSPRPLTSLAEGLYFLALFALIQAGRFLRARQPNRFDWMVRAGLYLSAGFYACMLLVGLAVAARYSHTTHEYLAVSFNNVRYLADYALLQVLLVFVGCHADYHRKATVLVILAGVFWLALLLTGGRGALIAWAGALMVVFIIRGKAAYRFIAYQLLAVLLALLVFWLLDMTALFSETGLSRDWTTDSGRLGLWGLASQGWLTNPLFGMGPMLFATVGDGNTSAHAHNLLIQWLAEWGLVPALFLLVLLVTAIIRILADQWSQRGGGDADDDSWNLPAMAVLSAVAALAMVQGVLYGATAAQLFVLAAVVLWSRNRDRVADSGSVTLSHKTGTWPGGLATLALLALLWLGAWQVREHALLCLEQGHVIRETPRLWSANRLCEPNEVF